MKGNVYVNPSHQFAEILMTKFEFPFVKIELFRDNPANIENLESLKYIIKIKDEESFKLMINHLKRIKG